MISDKSLLEASTALDLGYNKAQLEQIAKYVRIFLTQNVALAKKYGVKPAWLELINKKYPKKADLEILTGVVFASGELFYAFKQTLPQSIEAILDLLIWKDSLSHSEIKRELGIDIYVTKEDKHKYYHDVRKVFELKPEFNFFINKGNENEYRYYTAPSFNLRIGAELQKMIRPYYPRPVNSDFHIVQGIEKVSFIFEGEQEILREFPRLDAYNDQGQIKTSAKGRVSLAGLGKLQRKVGIKEFFPNDDVKYMKTVRSGLLASLISARGQKVPNHDLHQQIRDLFGYTFDNRCKLPMGVLAYFKGISYLDTYNDTSKAKVYKEIFLQLPQGEWVSAQNYLDFLRYNSLSHPPVTSSFAFNRLFFEVDESYGGSSNATYKEKHYITRSTFDDQVQLPFEKGICFLMAAFGLLDIAYDEVDFSLPGDTAYSPYEGLKYIRLTNLGAYVFGLADTYELPESFVQSVTILSEDSLTITAAADDDTASVVLEPYAVKVSPNRYRTDFSFFLKGVKNKKELESKISLFKQAVKVDLPDNWIAFLEELHTKIDPLVKVSTVKVFRIPKENTDLLNLIARDPILTKHSMKAEDYHIIVLTTSLAAFKSRLKEFGYLLG